MMTTVKMMAVYTGATLLFVGSFLLMITLALTL